MTSYADFAYLYDMLTEDVEYDKRADYLELLFKKFMQDKPSLIADIGCGTGTMCSILADRGYDMIGIDSSDSMLNVAREKSEGKNILYLLQDMTEFELYGTVDVCLSLLDSVNYLTEDGDFDRLVKLVKNYLNPGGLFIFDINTPYKFENVLSDNIFTYDSDDIFYVWENEYHPDEKICDFYLTFFVNENEKYRRIDEYHCERCYEDKEIEKLADEAGFEIVGKYGELEFAAPKEDSERIFYVLRKEK